VKHSLNYPPGSKITFQFPAKKGRGPVKLVWFDGNTPIPKPESLGPDDKVPGTGGVIMGEKGMIIHGSHGAGECYLAPESLMDQYSGKNAPAQKLPRLKGHAWDWTEAIRTGRLSFNDGAFTLGVVRTLEAIAQSLKNEGASVAVGT
jgi:hypothetical protein